MFCCVDYHSVFNHPPTEEYLGCFQVLAVVNKADTSIHLQVFVWIYIFNSFV